MKLLKLNLALMAGLFALLSISPPAVNAQADHTGHGGAIAEGDLKHFIFVLSEYLYSDEGKQKFPEIAAYDSAHPEETFLSIAKNTKPVLVDEILYADGKKRDCVSYRSPVRYFECSKSAFISSVRDIQDDPAHNPSYFRLVFHELLVQAELELPVNTEVVSDYPIASRLSVHLKTFEEYVPGEKEVRGYEKNAPLLRCEGMWRPHGGIYSLAQAKYFVITAFSNQDTYVSEIVYPIGASNPRKWITLGKGGKGRTEYVGIDKIAHFFTGEDRGPRVKIKKTETGIDPSFLKSGWYSPNSFLIEVFGVKKYFSTSNSSAVRNAAFLRSDKNEIGGIALECDNLAYNEKDSADYHQFFEKVSHRSWIRMNDDNLSEFDDVPGIHERARSPFDIRSMGWN